MIKYLIMDVDGSITDGKIYMGQNGEIMKAFSIKDGYVINYILKPAGIIPIVITARKSDIVRKRCEELGIEEVHQGKTDKFATLNEIVGADNIGLCAYFGDDIIDMQCMLPVKCAGGIVGCPSDAAKEVKSIADYTCITKAGEGALREFVEWLVSPKTDNDEINMRVKNAIDFLKKVKVEEKDIGKKQVINDSFYYTICSYDTKAEDECKLESHKKYIDIQIMLSGEELMDISDVSRLTVKEEYNLEKDVIFWNVPRKMARTSLKTGDCIVLYPENAHRGGIALNTSQNVTKIVGKIKI